MADRYRGPFPCLDRNCAGVKTTAGLAGQHRLSHLPTTPFAASCVRGRAHLPNVASLVTSRELDMKNMLATFAIVPLLADVLPAQRPWQQITVPSVREAAANFKTPPHEYGVINPFTSWNGPSRKARLRLGNGISETVLHPRNRIRCTSTRPAGSTRLFSRLKDLRANRASPMCGA